MALFLSTYSKKIDRKGRLSIPAGFRQVVGVDAFCGVVVYPSFIHPCIEACSMGRLEAISASIEQLDPFSEAHDAFATSILGAAVPLAFDGEGRIMLPDHLRELAGIDEDVAMIGKGQHFEIWNPALAESHAKEARKIALAQRGQLPFSPKDRL